MKVYCTRPRQNHEAPHLTEISDENLSGFHLCATCGMPLILQDRYVPISELGRGGFGYTFLAIDLKFGLKSRRALKQLRVDPSLLLASEIEQAKSAFQREYEILDGLKHQQIPKIYEPFEIQAFPDLRSSVVGNQQVTDYYYFVQEYIQGKDLAKCLETNHLFIEAEVRTVLGQMLEVLRYIHSQAPPIIHRDVKPSNIIRADDGNFHLIDFGAVKRIISKVTVGSAQTETPLIAPGFAPPEQSDGLVDFSTDLYALGKTCICLLEGIISPPKSWKPLPVVSDSLVSILDRMTAENLRHRYQSVTEVIDELTLKSLSNPSVVTPDLVTVSGSIDEQIDPIPTQPLDISWFKKIAIGSGMAISLFGLTQSRNILSPPLPIQVTKFEPQQYARVDQISGVPTHKLFKSCCSKTWTNLSATVNPIIGQSFPAFKLESFPPRDGVQHSVTGIKMLQDGEIDIALSSKPITETKEPSKQAANNNVPLRETTIAIGSSAVVVNPRLQIQGITVEQFGKIKNCTITNWKDIGGPNLSITIYMTDDKYVNEKCLSKVPDTKTTFIKVASDRGGFTVAPSNIAASECHVKTLLVGVNLNNLVSPYQQQKVLSASTCNYNLVNVDVIKNQTYPILSDLKVLFRADDSKVGEAYATMLMTGQIQKSIREAGYLPISELK